MSTCTFPKKAWTPINPDSGLSMFFYQPDEAILPQYKQIKIPCRKCDKCKASYASEWAVRMAMEMQTHEQNTFITLTYDEDHYAVSLRSKDWTDFMKRLRKYCAKHHNLKIRFQRCSEYGDKTHRPHFHAIIFGFDFPDNQYIGKSGKGAPMYRSEILNKLWGKGLCTIGEANMATATYLAKYITKTIYGTKDENGSYYSGGGHNSNYEKTDPDTGEVITLEHESMTMSNRPGIGLEYYKKYKTDLFPSGDVILNNSDDKPTRFPVPQYFYDKLKIDDPDLYAQSIDIKRQRGLDYDLAHPEENSADRRLTKAFIQKKAQIEKINRANAHDNPSYAVDMSQEQDEMNYTEVINFQTAKTEKRREFRSLFNQKKSSFIFNDDHFSWLKKYS